MSIEVKLRDSHLVTGSDDLFRNAIGGFYNIAELEEESGDGLALVFSSCTPLGNTISDADALIDTDAYPESHLIKNVFVGLEGYGLTVSSSTSIFPHFVIPISIEGNIDVEGGSSLQNSDKKWKAYVLGETYAGVSYKGIISRAAFDVSSFDYDTPYPLMYLKTIDNGNEADYVSVENHSVYNFYIPDYQTFNDTTTEIGMLNFYDLVYCNNVDADLTFDDVKSRISIDEEYVFGDGGEVTPDQDNVFTPTETMFPELSLTKEDMSSTSDLASGPPDEYYDRFEKSRAYYLDFVSPPDDRDPSAIIGNENILINKKAISDTFTEAATNKKFLPFYNKISLPTFDASTLNQAIVESNFSSLLLKSIKDTFVEGLISTNNNDFVSQTIKRAMNDSGELVTDYSVENVTYTYVDYAQVLAELNNNPSPLLGAKFERFIGEADYDAQSAVDYTALLRHVNKKNAYNMFKQIHQGVLSTETTVDLIPESVSPYLPYAQWAGMSGETQFYTEDFLNLADGSLNTMSECVALRIQKTNTVSNDVQNIIIQNQPAEAPNNGILAASSVNTDNWCYIDSQVKYGTPYEYKVFAYFMVVGYKYEYSDIALSRVISQLGQYDDDDIIQSFSGRHGAGALGLGDSFSTTCIEFYDPDTNNPIESPMLTVNNTMQPIRFNLLNNTAEQGYATTAQELVRDNRVNWADFNLTIEPTIRVFEVPLHTKQLTVQDNPPAKMEVMPYQVSGQEQKIGFYVKLESFSRDVSYYPTPLNSDEQLAYSRYLTSNNMLDTDMLQFASISETVAVQVYRLAKKPTSMTDFQNNLVSEKSLILEDLNNYNNKTYASPTCFHEERISTGRKYYYAFRFLNENGVPSPWSHVMEAEIIDDGGYKYAVFNSIMQTELDDSLKYENPFDQFKKIFTLRPTIPQIDMDTLNLNYDNSAVDEYDNVQPSTELSSTLFDKKFKIRLTSKKTGKKIDLNVTYNIIDNTDYNSI